MFKRKKSAPVAGVAVDPVAAALGDPKAVATKFPQYTVKDIKAMQAQFATWIDQANGSNKSNVTTTEAPSDVVVKQPEVVLCGLFALAIYARSGNTVPFHEYVEVLTLFHPKTSFLDKQKAMFQLYDVDRDGVVSPDDAHHVLTRYLDFNVDVVETIATSMRPFMKTSAVGLTPVEFNQVHDQLTSRMGLGANKQAIGRW
ncbi:hypothetical protein, variant 2 [Aphanomyces astaci]|uniref:EF-hand domain-containing protein n=1 Tax=Aphanomyces astaci TaxID=112090 RepID=W4HCG9_APHAT|nr:hypothetical protein, variant 2 [Aphanomyces astaci]ETV89602.1 hypothetical protein, variant 2 [Aphanomyces astaci]|eukprot:XP_009822002.1 hypothetical protein, variant 2 [Aphanomyces astaci]